MFTQTFYCAFENETRSFIVKLAAPAGKQRQGSHRAVSSSRIYSQLATALCAYAEHLHAENLYIAVPKGHREYAAWMRSCLYVGLKLTNGRKTKEFFSNNDVVLMSLKIHAHTKEYASSSVGSASTYEGDSESIASPKDLSDNLSEASSSEFYLDLNA